MLKRINKRGSIFEARDEEGRYVFIEESISFIFQTAVGNGIVTYKPLNYKNSDVLEEIEKYLCGSPNVDMSIIDSIVIRYGWMDSRLNKLSFRPLTSLMADIRGGDPEKVDKRKLTAICKQLSLSMKKVKKS